MKKKILFSTILTIFIFSISMVNSVEAKCFGWGGFLGFEENNIDNWVQKMEKFF